MYAEGHKVKDAKKLPLNLLDALRALDKLERAARAAFGEDVIASYIKLGRPTGTSTPRHLTEWERQTTLDC